MKLLYKTNIFSSLVTVILLLSGVLIVYYTVIHKIDREQDVHLQNDKHALLLLLHQGKPFQLFNTNIGERIKIHAIPKQTFFKDSVWDNTFKDADADQDDPQETITFRNLYFQTKIKDTTFEITISRSLAEGDEISSYIATAIFLFLFFSLLVLFLLNTYISKLIFRPFYHTVRKIKDWSVTQGYLPEFTKTDINEFQELNETVKGLMINIVDDFTHQKEFTENISHETQTPVAIISGKLELLMQDSTLTPERQKLLMEAYSATQRLKRLNQTLISLTRIENKQYGEVSMVSLDSVILDTIEKFQDFADAGNIKITHSLMHIEKLLNEELFVLMLNNLIMNAIKHNYGPKGFVHIELNANGLVVTNSGWQEPIQKQDIFSRFKRYKTTDDSFGLGLSILKKITDFLGWYISYEYHNGEHRFLVEW